MALGLVLVALAFVKPSVQAAKPGSVQPEGQYVVSPEGVFRIEKGKVQRAPKKFHPAFVFVSEERFKVGIKPAEPDGVTVVSADGNGVQVRYSDGFIVRKGAAKALTAGHEIESSHAIVVAPGAEEYLLIRWAGGCSFTLMKNDGDVLREVGSNVYECGK